MSALRISPVAEKASDNDGKIERFDVLGVPVSIVDINTSVSAVFERLVLGVPGMVFVREVPSLMLACENPTLKALHEDAFLVVPDGMPLVWVGKTQGLGARLGRVAGADLLDAVCAASIGTGLRHYFYGGKPGVAEAMAARLIQRHPGLDVAGTFSPPMRDIDADFTPDAEVAAEIAQIAATGADFIWVGLSSPKQEYWMAAAASRLESGVLFGVGAAFDFHSGAVERAPLWMQRAGLEWLHRLCSEPRRLWRRYLVLAPLFAWRVAFYSSKKS